MPVMDEKRLVPISARAVRAAVEALDLVEDKAGLSASQRLAQEELRVALEAPIASAGPEARLSEIRTQAAASSRMPDKDFEMRVASEGTWTAVASGERAPTLLALEARRARDAEESLVAEVRRLRARAELLDTVLQRADKLGDVMAEFPDYPAAWSEYLQALWSATEAAKGGS